MTWTNMIEISKLDNGYTIASRYTIGSDKKHYKTETEIIKAVALSLSNNIHPDQHIEVDVRIVDNPIEEPEDDTEE